MLAACLSGCAGSPGGITEVGSFAMLGGEASPEAPTATYIRIARGAKACWFAPGRPLNGTYVFAGEVQPPSKGGDAAIVIYERADDGRRGLKAFNVSMTPSGEGTAVGRSNSRIPEPFATRMLSDVDRWVEGATGCAEEAGDWTPVDPAAEPAKPAAKKKKKAV